MHNNNRSSLRWTAPACPPGVVAQWIPGDASSRARRQQSVLQWAERLLLPVDESPEQAAQVFQRPVVGSISDGPLGSWYRRKLVRRNAYQVTAVADATNMGQARICVPLNDPLTGIALSVQVVDQQPCMLHPTPIGMLRFRAHHR